MSATKIKPCLCLRCGHHWEPRTAEPVSCPRCKSFQWKTEADPRYIRKPAVRAEEVAR